MAAVDEDIIFVRSMRNHASAWSHYYRRRLNQFQRK
jgi:hypothetical protein